MVNILKGMKVELSTVNVQTKPPNRRQLKSLAASTVRPQNAPEDAPQKRSGEREREIDKQGVHISRSEERRVGKECLRLCRSRWSPYH